jgi:List-Bact-rpt repeat protein
VRGWILLGIAAAALSAWSVSTASARTLHYLVTVTVSGPGRVTGSGDGGSIDCPNVSCTALIKQGTTIVLAERPDGGATFGGWGGDCSGAGDECSLTMTGAGGDGKKNVTAGFDEAPPPPPPPPPTFPLTVKKIGTGTGFVGGAGGIDCGPDCVASFPAGWKVTLLAVADDGSVFKGWGGAGCTGTQPCDVTIGGSTEITAHFDHVDRDAPHLRTIPSSARPGRTALLRYRVFDDSGESAETFTIMRGKAPVGRVVVPIKPVVYGRTYTAPWRVPAKTAKGKLLFCAVAADRTGNPSKRSCSTLRIT